MFKGLGYVELKEPNVQLNKTDPNYYDNLFNINQNCSYKIYDTAG